MDLLPETTMWALNMSPTVVRSRVPLLLVSKMSPTVIYPRLGANPLTGVPAMVRPRKASVARPALTARIPAMVLFAENPGN